MAVTAGMVDMTEVKLTLSLQVKTVRNAVPRSIRVITIREICHEGFELEGVCIIARDDAKRCVCFLRNFRCLVSAVWPDPLAGAGQSLADHRQRNGVYLRACNV